MERICQHCQEQEPLARLNRSEARLDKEFLVQNSFGASPLQPPPWPSEAMATHRGFGANAFAGDAGARTHTHSFSSQQNVFSGNSGFGSRGRSSILQRLQPAGGAKQAHGWGQHEQGGGGYGEGGFGEHRPSHRGAGGAKHGSGAVSSRRGNAFGGHVSIPQGVSTRLSTARGSTLVPGSFTELPPPPPRRRGAGDFVHLQGGTQPGSRGERSALYGQDGPAGSVTGHGFSSNLTATTMHGARRNAFVAPHTQVATGQAGFSQTCPGPAGRFGGLQHTSSAGGERTGGSNAFSASHQHGHAQSLQPQVCSPTVSLPVFESFVARLPSLPLRQVCAHCHRLSPSVCPSGGIVCYC
jgi:hypothetical protein